MIQLESQARAHRRPLGQNSAAPFLTQWPFTCFDQALRRVAAIAARCLLEGSTMWDSRKNQANEKGGIAEKIRPVEKHILFMPCTTSLKSQRGTPDAIKIKNGRAIWSDSSPEPVDMLQAGWPTVRRSTGILGCRATALEMNYIYPKPVTSSEACDPKCISLSFGAEPWRLELAVAVTPPQRLAW